MTQEKKTVVTQEMIAQAEKLAGLTFTASERELALEGLNKYLEHYEKRRTVQVENSVPMALSFDPRLLGMTFEGEKKPFKMSNVPLLQVPLNLEDLAFYPVTHLYLLIRSRLVRSKGFT